MNSERPVQSVTHGMSSATSGWIGLFRRVPIGLRIFIVVLINALGLVLVASFIGKGAAGVDAAGHELQRIRSVDRTFTDIAGDISRMQSVVQRFLAAPAPGILDEIETAKSHLFARLIDAYPYDEDIAAELTQAGNLARSVLNNFDQIRALNEQILVLYRDQFLMGTAAVTRDLAALDMALAATSSDSPAGLGEVKDQFFRAVTQANTYYLSRDHAAFTGADAELAGVKEALKRLRPADQPTPLADLARRIDASIDTVRLALTALHQALDDRALSLANSIASNQADLANDIGRVTARIKDRTAAAQSQLESAVLAMRSRVVIIGLTFLSASILASFAVAASIGRPVNQLRRTMLDIVGGNTASKVEGTDATDEIGAMARAVEVFQENMVARIAADREREAQERRWRLLLESSPIGVSVVSAEDGKRLYANQKFRALFETTGGDGSAPERPIHAHFADMADAVRLSDAVKRFGAVSGSEIKMVRADRVTPWWCLMEVRPIEFAGRPAHIFWSYDVTDRHRAAEELRMAKDAAEAALVDLKEAQESLIEAEKLAAIGGLVAGVAHEVNNPVGISLTVASSLDRRAADFDAELASGALRRSRLDEFVAMVRLASGQLVANLMRAAELVQSFKQVAVDRVQTDRRAFDLAETVDQILASLKPSLKGPHVAVTADLAPGLAMDSYPGQLGQVITNLFMNALLHAFGEDGHGTIAITARAGEGDTVIIRVSDDGRGMDDDTRRRAFDPFFTTKRGQGGTGLGLHIAYNIVTLRLGGTITLDTAPGKGSRFAIEIPRIAPAEAPGGDGAGFTHV